MNSGRVLYEMMRADFLERVRRTSFLVALGFALYLGYAVWSGEVALEFGDYVGVSNAAWLGAVIGLVASVWLSLFGFYVVKNTVERDRRTGVGQILAATPMTKSLYTLGKALSNFAVLGSMVLVLALAAVVIQLANRAHPGFDVVALLGPVLVLGLSAVAVTAALAVLFESLPGLRGGLGNILYFFLWMGLIVLSIPALEAGGKASKWTSVKDFTGLVTVMGQARATLQAIDPGYIGGASFTVGGLHPTTKTFLWMGVEWTPGLLLTRVGVVAVAVVLALLAAVFFDRFDAARGMRRAGRGAKAGGALEAGAGAEVIPAATSALGRGAGHLTPMAREGVRSRMGALVMAELRLMLKGRKWWWYLVAAGLFGGCLFASMEAARGGVLAFAWVWPVLIWAEMGTREARNNTGALVFSAPRAAGRQLMACYLAGVLLAALTGGGMAIHMVMAGAWEGLGAWTAGALFIPALALGLGSISASRKPFEALYTMAWYVGPLHHIRGSDFVGTTAQSSTAWAFAALAVALVGAAYLRRNRMGWRAV